MTCDGSGGGVEVTYFGGDGKSAIYCPFCKRGFVAKARKSGAGGEHWYANLPTHKPSKPKPRARLAAARKAVSRG